MATSNWFDLSDYGAKVERLLHNPQYGEEQRTSLIELTLRKDSETFQNIKKRAEEHGTSFYQMRGWYTAESANDNVIVFRSKAPTSAAQMKDRLIAFFSDDQIIRAYVPVENLSQDEKIEGIRDKSSIELQEVKGQMVGVSEEHINRALKAVALGKKQMAEIRTKIIPSPLNYSGDKMISKLLVSGFEVEDVASFMIEATRGQYYSDAYQDALRSLDLDDLATPITEEQSKRLVDLLVSDGVSEKISQAVEVRSYMAEEMGEYSRRALSAHDEVKALIYAVDGSFNAIDYDFDPAHSDALDIRYNEEKLGFRVKKDPTIPTQIYVPYLKRLDRIMDLVAEALDTDRGSVIPRIEDIPLSIQYRGVENGMGVQQGSVLTIGAETEDQAIGLGTAVMGRSSFIHEFGHLVDRSRKMTDDQRAEILSRSGIGEIARAQVSAYNQAREFSGRGFSSDYLEYLNSDKEIFARAFEASIYCYAQKNYPDNFRQILGGNVGAMPYGGSELAEYPEALSMFVGEVKSFVNEQKSVKIDLEQEEELGEHLGNQTSYAPM